MIETMDTNEAAAYLRECGLRISNEALVDGLELGIFPFGHAYAGSGKRRIVMIFKTLLDQWVAERTTKED